MNKNFLIAAALAFGLVGCADTGSGGDVYGAESVCKKAVKNSVKSPGTAKFHNLVTIPSGDGWDTDGDVDSENGFGALLRSHFECHATLSANGDTYHGEVTSFVDGGDTP